MRWTPALESRLAQLVALHKPYRIEDWIPIGAELGVSGHAARMKHRGMQSSLSHSVTPETPPNLQDSIGNTYVTPLQPEPLTEQQALELFQVDVTKWEVERITHNCWNVGSKGPEGDVLTTPLFQTTLKLKRKEGEGLVELGQRILQDIRDAAPPKGPFVIRKVKGSHLLEIDPVDLHFAKLGWSAETESSDYDLTIAGREAEQAADDLFTKTMGYDLAEVLLVLGNDEQHTDNLRSETTSGTRVDSDSRMHKMFRRAVQWRIFLIQRALQRAPVVYAKTVPGNHDRVGAFTVGEVVRAYFNAEPRVVFDNEPPLRKYHRFGKTLLGYTHGSEEKMADLPLIMAQERPQDWAETIFRGWRIGHFHKRKQTRYTAGDSFTGVEVRVMRSLSGTDQWHYSKGFVKERRGIEAFVHHREEGEVGAFISRIPEGV